MPGKHSVGGRRWSCGRDCLSGRRREISPIFPCCEKDGVHAGQATGERPVKQSVGGQATGCDGRAGSQRVGFRASYSISRTMYTSTPFAYISIYNMYNACNANVTQCHAMQRDAMQRNAAQWQRNANAMQCNAMRYTLQAYLCLKVFM